jgi:hypothetical protein
VIGDLLTVQGQIHDYFTVLYGNSYAYRAPETFTNALERWMLLVAAGDLDAAASQMAEIEEMIRRDRS